MTPEQQLNAWLASAIPKTWMLNRIEASTVRGIPDLYIATRAGSIWIEAKADGKLPKLRPDQYAWMLQHKQAGGLSAVVHRDTMGYWNLYRAEAGWIVQRKGVMIPDYSPAYRDYNGKVTFTACLWQELLNHHNARRPDANP